MSHVQRYLGPFGRGSIMKYIANHLVTIHNVAAAEAILLGIKAGMDPALVYDTLADSAGTSRMFQMRGPLMRHENYDGADRPDPHAAQGHFDHRRFRGRSGLCAARLRGGFAGLSCRCGARPQRAGYGGGLRRARDDAWN